MVASSGFALRQHTVRGHYDYFPLKILPAAETAAARAVKVPMRKNEFDMTRRLGSRVAVKYWHGFGAATERPLPATGPTGARVRQTRPKASVLIAAFSDDGRVAECLCQHC
jgi:uncharacterized protein YfaQ (DUF2300 family)